MQAICYCADIFGWLFGCGSNHSEAYKAAEALFLPEELSAIKQQYHAHVLATYSQGLDKRHLLVSFSEIVVINDHFVARSESSEGLLLR